MRRAGRGNARAVRAAGLCRAHRVGFEDDPPDLQVRRRQRRGHLHRRPERREGHRCEEQQVGCRQHRDPQGHRQGYQSWTHFLLQQQGLLPQNYQPPKCFFGQHLLAGQPDKAVAIVESEKTAVVMALCQPQHIWLATAGCGGLTPQKTACLKGRRVLLFPDSGCYEKWRSQMKKATDLQTNGANSIQWTISKRLEAYPPNTDLVDLLNL